MTRDAPTPTVAQVGLIALFVTALVTAQLTASKVLAFELPVDLPVTGAELLLPGAALAYAITFLASDCYTELYGRRAAQVVVNVAFAMNLVLLALVWSTIVAPGHPSGVEPEAFADVLGAGTAIVLGSLVAYLVSQNYDVIVFHRIGVLTEGRYLWLRNIVSTGTSQIIDTVLFVTIAFWVFPQYVGLGPELPAGVVLSLIVGQYLLKLAIVVVDTPFVYLITGLIHRYEPPSGRPVSTDAQGQNSP